MLRSRFLQRNLLPKSRALCSVKMKRSQSEEAKRMAALINGPRNENLVKTKIALVISYLGSNYHGLQMNLDQPNVPFVEKELKRALLEAGAILPSNATSDSKIHWSRSSRTDKGVHAARLVISACLLIPREWVGNGAALVEPLTIQSKINGPASIRVPKPKEEVLRFKEFVDTLNDLLPQDIRVQSCVKVNNKFQARNACRWREYQYIMPAEVLTIPVPVAAGAETGTAESAPDTTTLLETDVSVALERFNAALAKMVGVNSFHNFNKVSSRDVMAEIAGPSKWERLALRDSMERSSMASSSSTPTALKSENSDSSSGAGFVPSINDDNRVNESNDSISDRSENDDKVDTDGSDRDSDSDSDSDSEEETGIDKEQQQEHRNILGNGTKQWKANHFEQWVPVPRPKVQSQTKVIYKAVATLEGAQKSHTGECIALRVLGSSFSLQ
jgi:tRNA pseudouridine(38-40) synthase